MAFLTKKGTIYQALHFGVNRNFISKPRVLSVLMHTEAENLRVNRGLFFLYIE